MREREDAELGEPEEVSQVAPVGVDREMYSFIQFLVENYEVSEELEKIFWAYASKEIVLSNLTEAQITRVIRGFDDTVLAYLQSKEEHAYSWDEEIAISQFRPHLFVRLNRSKNGFERRMQVSQIQVSRAYQELGESTSEGLWGKIRKAFRGRR